MAATSRMAEFISMYKASLSEAKTPRPEKGIPEH